MSPDRVRALEALDPSDPERLLERLEGAFALRHDDGERAFRVAHEVLAIADAHGHRHPVAVAHLVAAYSGGFSEQAPATVVQNLKDAHVVLEEVGDSRNIIRSADLLATVYESVGDYPVALSYTQSALSLSRSTGYRLFEGYALSSLAGILTAAGDLDEAKAHLEMALVIAEELDVAQMKSRLYVRLGRVERKKGDTSAAFERFRRAQAVARENGVRYNEIDATAEIAATHEVLEAYDTAERGYEEALSMMDEEIRTMTGPSTMLGLARVCLQTGRPLRTIELVDELRSIAETFKVLPVQSDAAKLLSEANQRLGRFEAALHALTEHLALQQQIMQSEAQRAVKRQQVKSDLEAARKDAEIYRLKYVELETMQTQLVESERLAVLGSLTAGLAHEVNTPLGVLKSSLDTTHRALERLSANLPSEPSRAVDLSTRALSAAEATSRSAVERIEELVGRLRRFTRLDEAEYQRTDVVDGIEAAIDVLSSSLPDGIHVERNFKPVPHILGWPGALNQAFFTLLKNAAEALKTSGTIRVETDVATSDEIVVRIQDDGPGIPPEVKDRLFDFELSREGPRARFRVGLATVLSVVQRHRGRVTVDSELGQGARFALYFPTA